MRADAHAPSAGRSLNPEHNNDLGYFDLVAPAPVHAREPLPSSDATREEAETITDEYDSEASEREATELRDYDAVPSPRRLSRVLTAGQPPVHRYDPVKRFWRHCVRIAVPHEDCRDHLANERTYLGYLRSSLALSMLGTVIAQFYTLERDTDPSTVFGYSLLGKPLSVIFQASALLVVLLGGVRFLRQQNSMAVGKVHAGGWEMFTIMGLVGLLLVSMFFVHVGLIIYQDKVPPD